MYNKTVTVIASSYNTGPWLLRLRFPYYVCVCIGVGVYVYALCFTIYVLRFRFNVLRLCWRLRYVALRYSTLHCSRLCVENLHSSCCCDVVLAETVVVKVLEEVVGSSKTHWTQFCESVSHPTHLLLSCTCLALRNWGDTAHSLCWRMMELALSWSR